jgi:radical SAM superfamily enzyme YgiQ (UPF0313 family)
MYKKAALVASAILTIERPPAAIAILAGVCEEYKVDYEFFDFNLFLYRYFGQDLWEKLGSSYLSIEEICSNKPDLLKKVNNATDIIVTKIKEYNPDLLVLSTFSTLQIPWTKLLLTKIREKINVTIIAGGPGISYEQEPNKSAGRLLADSNLLDYYVLGEGDKAFADFLKNEISLGINSKDDQYETWVPQIDDLDSLVLPTYKKLGIGNYQSFLSDNATQITITGSRGCVRRCTFCDVGNIWKKFRFRSSASIVAEIVKHYEEVGCLNYFFSDSLINGSLKQFIGVLESLIKLQDVLPEFKNLRYSGQFIIRPKAQHPEYLYELMQQSGCDHLEIGIESGSERVRKHMGKNFSNADIDYHLEMCNKYSIKNHLLMFTAYPTETIEDHNDTIEFFRKNQKYLINDTIIGTNLNSPVVIYKNTPLDKMRKDLGITVDDMQYENVSNWISATNPELTLKERWRRYLELIKLTSKLRYKRATLDLNLLDSNLRDLISAINKKKIVINDSHN